MRSKVGRSLLTVLLAYGLVARAQSAQMGSTQPQGVQTGPAQPANNQSGVAAQTNQATDAAAAAQGAAANQGSATTAPASMSSTPTSTAATPYSSEQPAQAMSTQIPTNPQSTMSDSAPQQMASNTAVNGSQAPQLQVRNPRYRIQKGDQIAIKFEFVPSYSETIQVQPDGYISLEGGVPAVYAEGKTQPELEEEIRDAYKGILKDPVVTVQIVSFIFPYFICWGQVYKPGKYELRGDLTVSQAIGVSGGFNNNAKHSQVVLFRKVNDQWVSAKVIDVKRQLYSANLSEDMHLQPGDMIWVPKNFISKFYQFIPINTFRMDYVPSF